MFGTEGGSSYAEGGRGMRITISILSIFSKILDIKMKSVHYCCFFMNINCASIDLYIIQDSAYEIDVCIIIPVRHQSVYSK